MWSGASGIALKGLEIGGLALIDIDNNTAMSLEAIQTPSSKELKTEDKKLVDQYSELIIDRTKSLSKLSNYIAVDGCFVKRGLIDSVIQKAGLQVISKLLQDANLMYLYTGKKNQNASALKNMNKIDKRKIRIEYEDEQCKGYCAAVWSIGLKRETKLAYLAYWKDGSYAEPIGRIVFNGLNLEGEFIYINIIKVFFKSSFIIVMLNNVVG